MSILYCQKSSNIFFADFFCANTFQLQYHYMQPLELFPGKYKYVTLWYTMIPNITTRTVRDSEVRCDSTVSSQRFVRSRVHCRRDPNLPYPASMLLKLRNIPTKDALHTRILYISVQKRQHMYQITLMKSGRKSSRSGFVWISKLQVCIRSS